MSIEALKWALDIGEELGIEPPRRLVLIMLGNSADPSGGNLFPSHGYISRRTGLANSTVRGHIAALVEAGLLVKEPRTRDDRGQTSNHYRLAMRQPGLALEDHPLPESGRGVPRPGRAPASRPAPPPSHSMVLKQDIKESGLGTPSPVAACFEAYQHGIKAVYGADYPPSASANGMLSQIVKKLGAEPALAVVRAYLASTKPFYVQRRHAIEVLAKDATTIWIEIQQRSGARTAAEVASKSVVAILGADRQVSRILSDYPVGEPQEIAKRAYADHKILIGRLQSAKYIGVRQGTKASVFSIEELRS